MSDTNRPLRCQPILFLPLDKGMNTGGEEREGIPMYTDVLDAEDAVDCVEGGKLN